MDVVQALGGPAAIGAIGVGAAKAAMDVITAKIQADAQVKIAKIQANAPNDGGQSQGAAD